MLNTRLTQLLLGALLTIALVGVLPASMLWLDLNAFEKQQLRHLLEPRLGLMALLGALGLTVPVLFFGRFYHRHLHSLERVNRRLRQALDGEPRAIELDEELGPEERRLFDNANALMTTVEQRRESLAREIDDSRSSRERERVRLGALLAQVSQGVMVCNLEGGILLANARARSLLSDDLARSELGESVFALLDADLLTHALTIVRERLHGGPRAPHTTLNAISRGGRLLRVRLAAAVDPADEQVQGFVLTLDDIESQHAQDSERDKLLHGLSRETRNLLTRLRTGLDSLLRDPALGQRQRPLLAALARDTGRHCEHLERLSFQRADLLAHTWPLEPILATDLVSAVEQRLAREHDLTLRLSAAPEPQLWLQADSYSLAKSIANCTAALRTEWELDGLGLHCSTDADHALLMLDVYWQVGELRQEDFRALATATRQRVAVGGRALIELIERHAGRVWLEPPQGDGQRLRIALPLGAAPAGDEARADEASFDFHPQRDATAGVESLLQQQYFTVLAVGAERQSAAQMARGESQLVALLLAGGKPQALVQRQLAQTTLAPQHDDADPGALAEFSRGGAFVCYDAEQLQARLSSADRKLVAAAGLLDVSELARLLFPDDIPGNLYRIATRLAIDTAVDDTGDQVKLVARVFNRLLTRLQARGIHTVAQLQRALAELDRERA